MLKIAAWHIFGNQKNNIKELISLTLSHTESVKIRMACKPAHKPQLSAILRLTFRTAIIVTIVVEGDIFNWGNMNYHQYH